MLLSARARTPRNALMLWIRRLNRRAPDGSMNIQEEFGIGETHATSRLAGPATFDAAVDAIVSVVRRCVENKVKRLLVDTTGLSGLKVPDVAQRYFMARKFSAAAGPGFKLVIVAVPAMIDPQKFGVTAMANDGVKANVFPTEAEAVAWLTAK